jgi:hypothetical protein
MHIAHNHPHVGEDGVVDMPMLRTWNQRGSLIALVRALIAIFQEKMPVFDRRKQVRPASSGRIGGEYSGNRGADKEIARANVSPMRPSLAQDNRELLKRQIAELETQQSDLTRTSRQLDTAKADHRVKAVIANLGENQGKSELSSLSAAFSCIYR